MLTQRSEQSRSFEFGDFSCRRDLLRRWPPALTGVQSCRTMRQTRIPSSASYAASVITIVRSGTIQPQDLSRCAARVTSTHKDKVNVDLLSFL